jgi:negative regulator of sigma-B (phosphoserine phosphatase)
VEVNRLQVGSYVRPCDGEAVAGDAIVVKDCLGGVFLSLIDALGHGREAADVALLAIRYLKHNAAADVGQVLTGLDEHLRGTRGAMVSIAFAEENGQTIACTGIGNTVIRRFGKRDETVPSPDGIVGVRFRSPRVSQLMLDAEDLLLMYSDGIDEAFFDSLTSLRGQPLDAIARRIVLDHGRLYDDAACLIARFLP